jgi:hypothetical protein
MKIPIIIEMELSMEERIILGMIKIRIMVKEYVNLLLIYRQEQYMKVIGKMRWETDKVSRNGLTVHDMKVNGLTTKQMALENWFMQMAIFMKANGETIKQMDRELTFMQMEPNIKVSGKMINNMAWV